MELYQLKTFVTVAEEAHLTRAADRLNTSQPTISAHIKALESQLGVRLFDRTPKGMRLTSEGKVLKEKAVFILQASDDLLFTAGNLQGELRGSVRLGLHTESKLLRITDILEGFQREYPSLTLSYHQYMSWQAPIELLARNLDAAFIYSQPNDERIDITRLDQINLVIIAPIGWKEELENTKPENLHTFPWVWTNKQCPFYHDYERFFKKVGGEPVKAVIVDQEDAMEKMVTEGIGLSLLAEPTAKKLSIAGNVCILNVPVAKMDLSLIYLKSRAQDPIITAIRRIVGRIWGLGDMEISLTAHQESIF